MELEGSEIVVYFEWKSEDNSHKLVFGHLVVSKNALTCCLSQGFHSCTNIMSKKQVGEERVYSTYTSMLLFITKGSQDWNSSRSGSRS